MRRILLSAAIGALSLAFVNPVHAQGRGGGGGHAGGGGAAHAGAAHVGGAGAYHGGGYYHGGYPYHNHYGYGYGGIGIGIGLGYPYYGSGLSYYDPTPIYVPAVGPTLGPSSYYSNYPTDPNAAANIAPPAVAPPAATPAAINVPRDEAYIRVLVPDANAEVLLEGKSTESLGRDRLFSSPKLDPNGKYTYTVTASWLDQGHLVRMTREVSLTVGQTSVADFRRPLRQEN